MIRKLQQLKAKKGFTLVELMVVIAIIGVLAAILIPLMNNFLQNARIQSANSTASSAQSSILYLLQSEQMSNRGMQPGNLIIYEIQAPAGPATGNWAAADMVNGTFGNAFVTAAGNYRWLDPRESEPSFGNELGGGVGQDSFEAFLALYFEVQFPDLTDATFLVGMLSNEAPFALFYPTGRENLITFVDLTDLDNPEIQNIANGRSTNTGILHRQIIGTFPVAGA